MPLISVIVPVYKVEKYLRRCVDSILVQTFSNFELILVDDGSPDNCPVICDEYAESDPRIRVIHKENGGLSSARNAALDAIKGEYICFVDSDDYITKDALRTLYDALVRTGSDISVGNMKSFNEKDIESDFYFPVKKETVLEGDDILNSLNQPCAPNRLYKSEIFSDIRFPVGRLYEDVFTYHKIIAKTKRMVLTGRVDYYYFIRSDSIMHSEYNIRFTDIIYAIKERYEWLDSIGQTALANEARLFIYSRVAVAYAHLDRNNPEHKAKLDDIRKIYLDCYSVLMKDKSISFKQKIRLWLLKYLPGLHTELFGKKMQIALG